MGLRHGATHRLAHSRHVVFVNLLGPRHLGILAGLDAAPHLLDIAVDRGLAVGNCGRVDNPVCPEHARLGASLLFRGRCRSGSLPAVFPAELVGDGVHVFDGNPLGLLELGHHAGLALGNCPTDLLADGLKLSLVDLLGLSDSHSGRGLGDSAATEDGRVDLPLGVGDGARVLLPVAPWGGAELLLVGFGLHGVGPADGRADLGGNLKHPSCRHLASLLSIGSGLGRVAGNGAAHLLAERLHKPLVRHF
mmetsp:Transcript_11465/g.29286  ORF Transcript_11465/g.29286 Transcript_11465/m.29286 type:complete len:249 (+) Transcript_11465:662-1408(+)